MSALLHQPALPSPTQPTRNPPWMLKQVPTAPLPSKRNYTGKARGKGFGVAAPNTPKKKPDGINQNKAEQIDGDEDEIPQEVFDRMLRRVLFYVGVPMASGIGLLYVLSMLKARGVVNVPGWLPLTAVLVTFGTSGLGIAFGTLSTSWDPEVQGSLLGLEEAKKNWPVLWKKEEQGEDKR